MMIKLKEFYYAIFDTEFKRIWLTFNIGYFTCMLTIYLLQI